MQIWQSTIFENNPLLEKERDLPHFEGFCFKVFWTSFKKRISECGFLAGEKKIAGYPFQFTTFFTILTVTFHAFILLDQENDNDIIA